MDRKSIVLYDNLLQDLSSHLPLHVINRLSVDPSCVDVWPDITPKQYACLALAKSFYKKNVDYTNADADDIALSKFEAVNEQCKNWSLRLEHSWEEEAIGTVKRHLENFFNPSGAPLVSDLCHLFQVGRVGPGASIGSHGEDYYTKMHSSRMAATTRGLVRAYEISLKGSPNRLNAEKFRSEKYGEPELVAGNRLSFVPKTKVTSRITCVEPSINMFGQLGLGSLIEKRLISYFGIDTSIQPDRNRELAWSGSVTGQFSTIDLQSASDSIAMSMIKEILPKDVITYLESLRSPLCDLPHGRQVQLHMVSTMGNGFTFPLQTAIFAAVVSAAYDMHGLRRETQLVNVRGSKRRLAENFGVFGDDIICYKETYDTVVRILNILGFNVNADKSFKEGPFRESCGGDYFNSYPVRGVYVKSLRTQQQRVVVLNRLHQWVSETGVRLTRTCRFLYAQVPKRFVPCWEADDAGIKVPSDLIEGQKRDKDTSAIVYYKWMPRKRFLDLSDEKKLCARRRVYNPDGLLLSLLGGYVRGERLSLRLRETTYTTKRSLAPSWDPARTVLVQDTRWRQWKTAVWLTVS